MKRKLIEVALPLEAINVASAKEKNIRHGHPSTLHLWWALQTLRAGLTFENIRQLQVRYRALYAIIGLLMVAAMIGAAR